MSDAAPLAPPARTANVAHGRALVGMASPQVAVETHLPGGLPGFTLVGLPETAVREARDRVRSAIQNCGLDFPQGKVVVNLAPADLAKEGARFDLAIAVSILRATRQVPARPGTTRPSGAGPAGETPPKEAGAVEFLGELGLFGELRATRGCLCSALAVHRERPSGTRLIIPAVNADEAAVAPADVLRTADHLLDVVAFLREPDRHPLPPPAAATATPAVPAPALSEVLGQHGAKRALTVAAAGGHHLLMVGPPGTGKTMLARRLTGLLPPLPDEQALEVASVYSAAGLLPPPPGRPPFRDPHHSASAPAIAGGGRQALPGEISLAHRGVLFLDELPHFKPSVLDLLREPLETRHISLARAGYRSSFPASFQLIAAMNPCPAGLTCSEFACRCSSEQVRRYQSRISGPLLDRIDLHVAVPPVPKHLMVTGADPGEREGAVPAERVAAARSLQLRRQGRLNAELPGAAVVDTARLNPSERTLLTRAAERYGLSARGTHRVLRVARTIADLEDAGAVSRTHLTEALSFRAMDWAGGMGTAG